MLVGNKENEVGGTSETSALNNSSASSVTKRLLSKRELAAILNVSERTIDNMVAAKKIPRLALSARMTRFVWPRVEAALARFEIKEVGARR